MGQDLAGLIRLVTLRMTVMPIQLKNCGKVPREGKKSMG